MLPGRIEALEKEIEELGAKLSDPGTFQPGAGTGKGAEAAGGATYKALAADVETLTRRLAEAEAELNAAYNRWGELEAL